MNVDEATQAAKEYNENFVRQHFPLPSVTYSQRVAITLLAEVEQLRAELAAAKAASVLPVKAVDCYAFGDDVEVVCKCSEDADCLSGWLRDRMKDKTPPEA